MIWAGFGPINNTEKKNWADYKQLFRGVFSYFWVQKLFLKFFWKYFAPQNMIKPPSNRAKFTINWRHLPARLPYNDFGSNDISFKKSNQNCFCCTEFSLDSLFWSTRFMFSNWFRFQKNVYLDLVHEIMMKQCMWCWWAYKLLDWTLW